MSPGVLLTCRDEAQVIRASINLNHISRYRDT